tara:strand:+ start:43 stop:621 length:579 start_codon:yes stop_codon:yes gene_type:complete
MSSILLNNLSNITHNGYLTLILGPMFAGKTTYLLKEIEKYETIYSKNKILVINHMSDNRYANNKISSHDKKMYPCLKKNKLNDITSRELEGKEIIVIDEGQFFTDIDEMVRTFINDNNLKIIVGGLNGTFQQKKFDTSNILNLIPFADNVIHLKSKCYKCGMEASFSKRIINDNQEILVGNNNYQPCCRKCL